jgi:hypothetical protein
VVVAVVLGAEEVVGEVVVDVEVVVDDVEVVGWLGAAVAPIASTTSSTMPIRRAIVDPFCTAGSQPVRLDVPAWTRVSLPTPTAAAAGYASVR